MHLLKKTILHEELREDGREDQKTEHRVNKNVLFVVVVMWTVDFFQGTMCEEEN